MASCERMLLYLNANTWTTEESVRLAADVALAIRLGVPLVLAHEMEGLGQDKRYGCPFELFFRHPEDEGHTPEELLKGGIYSDVAIALKGGEWRHASRVLMGQKLMQPPDRGNPTTETIKALTAFEDIARSGKLSTFGGRSPQMSPSIPDPDEGAHSTTRIKRRRRKPTKRPGRVAEADEGSGIGTRVATFFQSADVVQAV